VPYDPFDPTEAKIAALSQAMFAITDLNAASTYGSPRYIALDNAWDAMYKARRELRALKDAQAEPIVW